MGIRLEVEFDDTFSYREEIGFDLPDGMTKDEFEKLLDKAKRENPDYISKDLASIMERKHGVKLIWKGQNFPEQSESSECEVLNVCENR
ncbi:MULTISPECIES: hypothetical protein [Bacillus]|uniref:Uncharacterized protein n=1 Tax=Bacillus glycinifermentans TaxID=1664069 RepID=A0A0T6BI27_9BACI|nr:MULTISPECIES: hypothetical protein [Bacillus]KRT87101.1 hypothetical protein AB447_209035 [Bacillus glycinifermentans]MEC0342013.1 hypothetical protein [Bacillus sonorensis]MEC0457473.1 hypothetical protein [Bacillus sonorensis]MEC0487150.1 hypothetical protein [Bacillus glycinifermentans]MEC0530732.1 hypothetical protein [Bacillus sonorensis]